MTVNWARWVMAISPLNHLTIEMMAPPFLTWGAKIGQLQWKWHVVKTLHLSVSAFLCYSQIWSKVSSYPFPFAEILNRTTFSLILAAMLNCQTSVSALDWRNLTGQNSTEISPKWSPQTSHPTRWTPRGKPRLGAIREELWHIRLWGLRTTSLPRCFSRLATTRPVIGGPWESSCSRCWSAILHSAQRPPRKHTIRLWTGDGPLSFRPRFRYPKMSEGLLRSFVILWKIECPT